MKYLQYWTFLTLLIVSVVFTIFHILVGNPVWQSIWSVWVAVCALGLIVEEYKINFEKEIDRLQEEIRE